MDEIDKRDMNYVHFKNISKTDIIDDSIKEVRIDGYLDKKYVWDSVRWVAACRNPGCTEINPPNNPFKGLCKKHYQEQIAKNIDGERMIKGSKSYKWNGKEWRLLCEISLCTSFVTNMKTGRCSHHVSNPDIQYSGTMHASALYKQAVEAKIIELKKKKLAKKMLEKKKRTKENVPN